MRLLFGLALATLPLTARAADRLPLGYHAALERAAATHVAERSAGTFAQLSGRFALHTSLADRQRSQSNVGLIHDRVTVVQARRATDPASASNAQALLTARTVVDRFGSLEARQVAHEMVVLAGLKVDRESRALSDARVRGATLDTSERVLASAQDELRAATLHATLVERLGAR